MPNTFGYPATPSTVATFGGSSSSGLPGVGGKSFPLYDSRHERLARQRFRREMIPELAYANSLYVPAGRWPVCGWILLRREDYLQINPYATNLVLQIDDLRNPPLLFQGLTVVQARCVSTGLRPDDDSIYLVEITDARGVLWNKWFQLPTKSSYNVQAPAYPGLLYAVTQNTNTAWTWSTMLQDLWQQMSLLGSYPGLPIVPSGTPADWWFPGVSCWDALCQILDLLGCSVSCDLTSANPYGIVDNRAVDTDFMALQDNNVDVLEDSLEWIDKGSGRTPKTVTVFFHRANQYYGTEETVRLDTLQWTTPSFYTVSITGPFPQAAGTHYLWDDFVVRYDINGVPLPADVTTAATIAQERVDQYFARIYRGTSGYLWQLYIGALPFKTGSQVDGVAWRMDFKDDYRKGWVTEVIRGPQPPWPQLKSYAGD